MEIVQVETSCPSVSVSSSIVTFDQLTPTLVFCLILKCREDSLQIITNAVDFRSTYITYYFELELVRNRRNVEPQLLPGVLWYLREESLISA
jgi:hypothetical protein